MQSHMDHRRNTRRLLRWNHHPDTQERCLRDCNNWRGVTLLSVPGKVMCSIILDRIKVSVDKTLRQQQAGFRTGRSCDQILHSGKYSRRSMGTTPNLLINFLDFRKALDYVHRYSVWNIMKCYRIPNKIVNIIQNFTSIAEVL